MSNNFAEALGRKIPLYDDMDADLPPMAQADFGELIGYFVNGMRGGFRRSEVTVRLFCLFTMLLDESEWLDGDAVLSEMKKQPSKSRYSREEQEAVLQAGLKIGTHYFGVLERKLAALEAENPNAKGGKSPRRSTGARSA